jgi:hypothetical protein
VTEGRKEGEGKKVEEGRKEGIELVDRFAWAAPLR